MVETLSSGKETALKISSKKESFFIETTTEKKERINKFINSLEDLVKLPYSFIKAGEAGKKKIAEKSIIQIEENSLSNLDKNECKKLSEEEKVCFYCFKEEKTGIMHLYLYFLLITGNDKFKNILDLNDKKETKLKSISNLFTRKEISRRRANRKKDWN